MEKGVNYEKISKTANYLDICVGLMFLRSEENDIPEILKDLAYRGVIKIINIVSNIYGEGRTKVDGYLYKRYNN